MSLVVDLVVLAFADLEASLAIAEVAVVAVLRLVAAAAVVAAYSAFGGEEVTFQASAAAAGRSVAPSSISHMSASFDRIVVPARQVFGRGAALIRVASCHTDQNWL